jgi:hypothetical protein
MGAFPTPQHAGSCVDLEAFALIKMFVALGELRAALNDLIDA